MVQPAPDIGGEYGSTLDRRWWRKGVPTEDRYQKVIHTAEQIRRNQVWRKNSDVARLRSYTSMPIVGYGMAAYNRPAIGSGELVSFNLIKCVADAFTAKVTKERPKISVVTEGGDWELQEKARGLETFLEGEFYEADIYDLGPQVVLDGGGIFGTGFFYLCVEGEKKDARVHVERVLPSELLVDDKDSYTGKPTQILREKWIDRAVLEELYADEPEKVQKIHAAKESTDPQSGVPGYDSTADQLMVREAWHLKSGKHAKDGRYTRAIINCTLEDEEWPYEWLPFFRYVRAHPPFGYFGISLADDLIGIQNEINRMMMRVAKAMRLLGAGHVLAPRQAKVNFSSWDNEIGSKIEHEAGYEPKIFVPLNLVAPEVYAHIDRMWNRGFESTGTPMNFAQGETAPNVESGKAQEMALQVTDERIQVSIHRYHHMFLEIARAWLDLARTIVKEHNPDYGSAAMDAPGEMRRVLLREVDLPEESYRLKLWETNSLPDDPAERQKVIESWLNAGIIAPDAAKRLMGTLDLKREQSLEEASYDAVEKSIALMLNHGKYRGPQPFLNLEQAKRQVQLALLKGWTDGRPDARLQLLRDWLADCVSVENGIGGQPAMPQGMASAPGTPVPANPNAGPAMMPPPGGPPGLPPGPPGAPPMPQAA